MSYLGLYALYISLPSNNCRNFRDPEFFVIFLGDFRLTRIWKSYLELFHFQDKAKFIFAAYVAKCCPVFRLWIDICWYIPVKDLSAVNFVGKLLLPMEICIGKPFDYMEITPQKNHKWGLLMFRSILKPNFQENLILQLRAI